jgi:hypothetical protein
LFALESAVYRWVRYEWNVEKYNIAYKMKISTK